MINVLICGLNSYLGRASLQYLPDSEFRVHGLVRDTKLLRSRVGKDIQASIYPVDLIRKGDDFDSFHIQNLDYSIYFGQIPDDRDRLGVKVELLSLRNFIFLSQRDGCNRIIYVGRSYHKSYLKEVKMLFEELNVDYTLLVKDVAVGSGTSIDQFMDKILKHRFIYLYSPFARIQFRPLLLQDFFRFIKKVNWKINFIRQYLEFGGEQLFDMKELIELYAKARNISHKFTMIPIRNQFLAGLFNKLLYNIDFQLYNEYIREIREGKVVDNSLWQRYVDFNYLPIESGM